MARKHRHSILIYGASGAARRTIKHLKEKYEEAKNNPEVRKEWLDRYFSNLGEYIMSPERTKEAERKLTTWYEVLEEEVAPEFAKAVQKAKATYYKRLASKLEEDVEEDEESEKESLKHFTF